MYIMHIITLVQQSYDTNPMVKYSLVWAIQIAHS